MKNIILASISAVALLSVAACSDNDNSSAQTTGAATPTVQSNSPAATEPSPTVAPSTDNTTTTGIETQPSKPESGSGGSNESSTPSETQSVTPSQTPGQPSTPAQ